MRASGQPAECAVWLMEEAGAVGGHDRVELVENESEVEAEETWEDDPEAPDQLQGSTQFDVLSLVEDELILALPYVPKHEVCPSLPVGLESDQGSESVRPSPFAVLAELKKD